MLVLIKDFVNLKTGLAGMMLQKFINYHIKVAVILENEEKLNDRFKEMILEANKGNPLEHLKILQMQKTGFQSYHIKEKIKMRKNIVFKTEEGKNDVIKQYNSFLQKWAALTKNYM